VDIIRTVYWPSYACENDWWGISLSTWKFGEYWPTALHNADFQSIFARSASAVRASKTVKLTLIGVHYALSNEHNIRTLPLRPLKGGQNASVTQSGAAATAEQRRPPAGVPVDQLTVGQLDWSSTRLWTSSDGD